MAKRVNRKKQRQRIMILIVAFLLVLFLLISMIKGIASLFIPKKDDVEENVTKEEKVSTVLTSKQYEKYGVNELGEIPVMMYHGIDASVKSKDTGNTGGNIDVDGYQRTAQAFRKDLEMYHKKDIK